MLKNKPKTAAGKRVQVANEPQVKEGPKTALFLKGTTTSETVSIALTELSMLKKPDAVLFSHRNDIHPFDDNKPLEFLSIKNQAGLVVVANHSKKRPNNLVFCRMFDYQLLDMVELGVKGVMSMHEFKALKSSLGSRPVVLFSGEVWDMSQEMQTVKSIFMDMFGSNTEAETVSLGGLETLISITAVLKGSDFEIWFRTYRIVLKRDGASKVPLVELEHMGPHMDLTLRRSIVADSMVMREAMKVPKEAKGIKKVKNVEHSVMGETLGRIWLDKQDLSKLQTRKMKGLKRKHEEESPESKESIESVGK